jgi:hypothetical protein
MQITYYTGLEGAKLTITLTVYIYKQENKFLSRPATGH